MPAPLVAGLVGRAVLGKVVKSAVGRAVKDKAIDFMTKSLKLNLSPGGSLVRDLTKALNKGGDKLKMLEKSHPQAAELIKEYAAERAALSLSGLIATS